MCIQFSFLCFLRFAFRISSLGCLFLACSKHSDSWERRELLFVHFSRIFFACCSPRRCPILPAFPHYLNAWNRLSISCILNNLLIQVFERSGTPHWFVAVVLLFSKFCYFCFGGVDGTFSHRITSFYFLANSASFGNSECFLVLLQADLPELCQCLIWRGSPRNLEVDIDSVYVGFRTFSSTANIKKHPSSRFRCGMWMRSRVDAILDFGKRPLPAPSPQFPYQKTLPHFLLLVCFCCCCSLNLATRPNFSLWSNGQKFSSCYTVLDEMAKVTKREISFVIC